MTDLLKQMADALRDALSTPAEPRTVEPLTGDEVIKLAAVEFPSKHWQAVERLVRAVERHHGIGLVLAGGEQG